MQFKHPEILYALFLLLIPIFIHLFQLRRFQKTDFTNVAFLKKVTLQTRKSSQLKKWLVLLTRLLALACLIIAFAQPFTATNIALQTKKEVVLYIDNSFSMQAKGNNGELLQRMLQQLYELPLEEQKISWLTNTSSKKNSATKDFKNEVLSLPYTQQQLTPSEILLKARQLFTNDPESEKRLILVSDFQVKEVFPPIPNDISVDAVQLSPVSNANVAIDSVYITNSNTATLQLQVLVSASETTPETVPLSLYKNNTLLAKSAVDFSEATQETITFTIESAEGFTGRVELTEPDLTFDNRMYFSINKPEKIKILSINAADAGFLQSLFNQPEFEYTAQPFTALNYSTIPAQNFIILNEIETLPASLTAALLAFSEAGGSVVIIPGINTTVSSYNELLQSVGIGTLSEKIQQEKKITQIVFDHPIFKDVFEKRVVNFQYPQVNSYYPIRSSATSVLRFEDGTPFLLQLNKNFLLTAAINEENSNFKNSPLIVPTFYNMAQQSLALPKLYYTSGQQNRFSVPVTLQKDEIVAIKDSTFNFIPLQQTKANQVDITTTEEPAKAGNYTIETKTEALKNISYNYNRDESKLVYADIEDWEGVTTYKNIDQLFDAMAEANTINSFWKWFAIFALLFLLLEMLILKFYK